MSLKSSAAAPPRGRILSRAWYLAIYQVTTAAAAPVKDYFRIALEEQLPDSDSPELYFDLSIAAFLVLLGGIFAGLTIALLGLDTVYLQVIATSGEGKEQRHAQKVYRLLQRGKHWVLVTLLLANVIVNETLPIILDRSLGGGWPAVLGSTVLIGRWPTLVKTTTYTHNASYLWRGHSSIGLRAIWPFHRLIHVDLCPVSHVAHGTRGLANSETPGQTSWRRPRDCVQKVGTQNAGDFAPNSGT